MFYKFTPLLKTLIWGTESWQISGVPGSETTADGVTLNDIVRQQKAALLGQANYERFGDEFPLLIKFIDARQDLSIQVHPTDEIARRQGKPRGKTEMWYVMDSAPTASLYSGLSRAITPEQYKAMVADDTICDALARYNVREGDCFFIPAGRIHAIGAGCRLAEIQQTSDVTYRIYDYGRRDSEGRLRQLHTHEAAECIDYTVLPDYRQHYQPQPNQGTQLVSCPFFTTAVYDLTEPMTIDYSDLDSFVILIAMQGTAEVTVSDPADAPSSGLDAPFTLTAGESLLLPATVSSVRVSGTVKFLETFV